MKTYQIDFSNFKGSMETTCDFYNLNTNITLQTQLYRTPNKLCIEYKVIQRTKDENGFSNYNTLDNGYIETPLTYSQYQRPTKKIYITKIEKALKDVLERYFMNTEAVIFYK